MPWDMDKAEIIKKELSALRKLISICIKAEFGIQWVKNREVVDELMGEYEELYSKCLYRN